jgi:membrane protease YdiL (CAAX protease family)
VSIVAVGGLGVAGARAGIAGSESPGAASTLALQAGSLWALGIAGVLAAFAAAIASRAGFLSRRALDCGRLGRVRELPSPVWLIAAALAFLCQAIGGEVAGALGLGGDGIEATARAQSVAMGVAVVGTLGVAVLVARAAPGAGVRWRWRDLWVGSLAFCLVMPVVAFASIAAAEVGAMLVGPPEGAAHGTLRLISDHQDSPWAWVLIAVAVVGAPVVEEIVYRGLLQSALLGATGRAWVSVVVTAGIFALMHWAALPADARHALVPLFVLGVALGIVVERTKSIGAAIVVHALFNATNIALTFVLA